MVVSGQLRPTALPPEKEPLVPIGPHPHYHIQIHFSISLPYFIIA